MESEFDNIASKKDKVQDININQLKLEVHGTYKRGEKITSNFEPTDDSDVRNKGSLDRKLSRMYGHLSILEKDYNEFKLHYNKQSVEEFSNQRAVETTIQILCKKGLFDSFPNADQVLNYFSFLTRRRGDKEKVNDDIQWLDS